MHLQGAHNLRSDSQNEWSVGIGFVIPLFDGRRGAETGQIRSQVEQLSAQRDQALFLIEQRALAAGYGLGATHPAMLFSRRALKAATDNFEAVQTKYQQGAETILNLLDAQRELLLQKQNEALAGYEYLRDVVAMQRSIAWFEYSKSLDEKGAWSARLKDYLSRRTPEQSARTPKLSERSPKR
ncbi:MAG: TolC family protein [Planctomycetota bacterium]